MLYYVFFSNAGQSVELFGEENNSGHSPPRPSAMSLLPRDNSNKAESINKTSRQAESDLREAKSLGPYINWS